MDSTTERVLAGIVRDPAPVVDGSTLPSLTNEGTDVEFRGEPGGLKAVYFGYTNCPDVCPTTMSDWTVALRRLPEEIARQVDTVMVTVDPERDNDLLTGYVQSFVPDAEAAGTLDADRLAAAAEPFGVSLRRHHERRRRGRGRPQRIPLSGRRRRHVARHLALRDVVGGHGRRCRAALRRTGSTPDEVDRRADLALVAVGGLRKRRELRSRQRSRSTPSMPPPTST